MAKKKSKLNNRRPFKHNKPFILVAEREATEPAYGSINEAMTSAVFKVGSSSSPVWTCMKAKVDPSNPRRALLKFKAQTVAFTAAKSQVPPSTDPLTGPGTLTVTVQDTAEPAPDDPFNVDVIEVDTDPC